ncbi:unnamed protein product [Adineta ricciae]|uniref:Rho-GAP domain-containing protein n=1 Tax=Adineta ricciae TaxID=249248 RepID=A0A813RVX6_ADIRI|nr:unnamed protein product [Adineta ricciae]
MSQNQMAAPPSVPTPPKSRGLTLFDRQAQLHAYDTDKSSSSSSTANLPDRPTFSSKPITSAPIIYRSAQQNHYSPLLAHRRSPLSTSECHSNSNNNNNVQLIGIHPRPESTYIKEWPSPPPLPAKRSEQLLETDFPMIENPQAQESATSGSSFAPSDSLCCAMVEQAFDYLQTHDDNDDVVYKKPSISHIDGSDNEENSEGNDSVDTIDLDATTSTNHQTDSGIHTSSSSQVTIDKRHDSQEKLTDQQSPMASSSRGTGSEDNDSDFDNQSHEDDLENEDEQVIPKKAPEELINEQEELQKQLIIRQQKILWSIAQEWLRKEKSYIEQLEQLDHQLNHISLGITLQEMIQQLIAHHKNVCKEIGFLYERDHQPANLTRQLTRAIDALVQTLSLYDDYIKKNLAPIRKALDKRLTNGMSSEDLLSIPPKQFLQILSQVQDLYKTALSFGSDDAVSLKKLHDYAQQCKIYGNIQDENINKIVLKNEDVATFTRGSPDRCRLVLYPDAIVCCYLKSKLLVSPKYALLSFIPMISLHWTVPQTSSEDNKNTGDELKSNLKSSYKELEKAPKSNHVAASRLSKAIRKQEIEYNLAQSKLQLILSNSAAAAAATSRSSISFTILFSSAYQLQDWVDLIEKTKQELVQRSSDGSKTINTNHQRLTDSLIQKRLDLIKPNVQDFNSYESSSVPKPSKTYSGTLHITIHSIHGTALYNPARQQSTLPLLTNPTDNNYQFYVAVEIDSYNTFFPYAQTARRSMQQQESVEFKGEVFQVELEYSLAFRLLIYRIDANNSGNQTNASQRAQCIGKFHRNIETALHDCHRSANGVLTIESPSGDLKLKISLKYSKREGTFKRQGSKRSLAVFGKSIDTLLSTPNGCVDGIPRLIVKCIEMVDRDGLKETGIYRVCCVTSDLQKLRNQFDRHYHRGEELLAEKNVHVAANLLKLFFRELPEPLFTSALYTQFIHAIQLRDMDNQRVTLLRTLELLPAANRKILFHLLDHLIRVSEYSDVNMMHLDNLAVVFGPTLMRPSKLIMPNCFSNSNQRLNMAGNSGQTDLDQMSAELQGSMHQCEVVLACLKLRRDNLLK